MNFKCSQLFRPKYVTEYKNLFPFHLFLSHLHLDIMMQMDLEKINLWLFGDLLYSVEYILTKSNFKIKLHVIHFFFTQAHYLMLNRCSLLKFFSYLFILLLK